MATVYGSGLALKVPGISAHAGMVVLSAIVVDKTAYGVPIVAFTGAISWNGHENDPDAVDAAFCSALPPSPRIVTVSRSTGETDNARRPAMTN